jgi:hypothetical protein
MTMTNSKALMLAGLAIMSLGIGHAMAEGSGVTGPDYWAQQYRAAANKAAAKEIHGAVSGTAQSGTSDVDRSAAMFHVDTNTTGGGF